MRTFWHKKFRVLLLAAIVIGALFFTAQAQRPSARQKADLILYNGHVWTVDGKDSIAEAVAISDGKFVVVGSNRAALRLRTPRTQVIDLHGRFVTPGLQR